jgi:hypothetical protein
MELRRESPVPAFTPEPVPSAVDEQHDWRVSPILLWVKVGATVAFAVAAALLVNQRTTVFVAILGALVVGAWATRDLLAPVRLSADRDGVTVVAGYAGHRRLDWSQVERVRVDDRPRFGLRSEMLEIDTGEALYLFSTYDLNAPCADVAETLETLRTRR